MKLAPSEIFKVLGVESRIQIIELLKSKGPLGVKNIAEVVGLTPAAISQHLKVLRHAGLVSKKRKGYWVPYSVDEEALENCRCTLTEVCTCECKDIGPLKKQKLNGASMDSLMKYKKELDKELQKIQVRISQIKAKEK